MVTKSTIGVGLTMAALLAAAPASAVPSRPNILWITCEDISPYLGCYGDPLAQTPNIDRLAAQGIRYTHAYANAPVCAVARSTLIFGLYAASIGTHQMRTRVAVSQRFPLYPEILRRAGSYCTNNVKTDYNIVRDNKAPWDECSRKAHYNNRKPGQPFFAVFNFTTTHESQLSARNIARRVKSGQIPSEPRIPLQRITLPPYHPDLPAIRRDWARFCDLITAMDRQVGGLLEELDQSGLADDTIVFFYSDHGGMLARAKRYIYNAGTQVPLIVRFGKNFAHLAPQPPGTVCDRLVSFIDFTPTVLSLAGATVPSYMQGRIFLGPQTQPARDTVLFFRDRMAERYDFVRAVTDGCFRYIRNFMPDRPRGRDSTYGFTVQANWNAWLRAFEAGQCDETQSAFWLPKPVEELYETQSDPWEVHNLAGDPRHRARLETMRHKLFDSMVEIRDVGLIPEPLTDDLRKKQTLYDYAQSDGYHIRKLLDLADRATRRDPSQLPVLVRAMGDSDPIARYWGAFGCTVLNRRAQSAEPTLKKMLADSYAANRVVAAQALGMMGEKDLAWRALSAELDTDNPAVLLQALNAIEYAGLNGRMTRERWTSLRSRKLAQPVGGYVRRIVGANLK